MPERSPPDLSPPALAPDDPQLRLGQVLGSYRLVELLGKGGMGYVFRAEHVKLGREVALKLLRADYARRRDAVARFFQEAKTVNRVRHRNIVDVTDFVELEDGTTFIIMELLVGTSLTQWARAGVEVPRAIAMLVQICDGLAAAHAVGVVHRDLKPDNVFVMPMSELGAGGELIKLLDFGVAKLVNRDDEDVGFQTAAGSVIGTPAYMSPEQAGGMGIDARSDIYSLGAIMYELFCGQPMFRGRSFGEFVRKHLTEAPVPPSQTPRGAGIDPQLDAIVMRCLGKSPDERYQTVEALRDELMAVLGSMATQLPRARLTVTGAPPLEPARGRSSLWMWIAGGAAAVGLGIVAALWYAGSPASAPTPAMAAPVAPAMKAVTVATAPLQVTPVAGTIHVRFDSLPSGTVFAAGHAAALCTTPCALDIGDDAGDHPVFVIQAAGYHDAQVVVDRQGTQRTFALELAPLADAATSPPHPAATPVPRPTGKPAPAAHPEPAAAPLETRPATPGPIGPADTIDPFRSP
jgi:serine/threonine-protein kinase